MFLILELDTFDTAHSERIVNDYACGTAFARNNEFKVAGLRSVLSERHNDFQGNCVRGHGDR